jgi:lycopene cyclase domain-containing protein
VRHLAYVGMLAFCLVGTLPLEVWLGVRVYRQWRRLVLTLLCVAPVFVVWDLYAVSAEHWQFDREQTLGVVLPGKLPVEEVLFFVVIPVCSVLALEAVRRVRGWRIGDET